MLALEAVSKRFGAVHALEDVSLSVDPGEAVSLAGENGAGKSTLSNIAAGSFQPDAGRIVVDGRPVVFHGPADADAVGIRIVPQELVLCSNLTVAENVNLGHLPTGFGSRVDHRRMCEVAVERLERLGLDSIDVTRPVDGLPVAERALVQIARAMTPGVRLLVVDEPTAPLSRSEADRLLGVIQSVVSSGVAVIYISHRLDEVFRLSDRVAVLRNGRLVADLPRADLTREKVVQAMVGERSLDAGAAAARSNSDPVLRVSALEAESIDQVSFEAREGEVLAIYGITGSGRDALGLALFGAVPRFGGEVAVDGQPVGAGIQDAIAAGIGYVPAERRSQGLVLDMSIRENLTLSTLASMTRRRVLSRGRERAVAEHWIETLQLSTPSVEAPVRTLSGGTQQKVLLARWLAAGSRVLVLDEPTRGVDIATKAEIYRLVRRLVQDGTAVVVISSDIEEVETIGDRVLVLRRGRIVAELVDADQQHILNAALAENHEEHLTHV